MSKSTFNRRQVLTAALGTSAGLAVGGENWSSDLLSVNSDRKRLLRFAHLTDVHVQTERNGDKGFAAALQHVQQQLDPPEFIMFGGDNVMNVDSAAGAEKADQQLATWNRCLDQELSLPRHICIGNHDILKLDANDGKKWATDAFGLEQRYYSFDRNGWRFIVLDSTSPEGGGYKGRLDEAQFDWLKTNLAETDPTLPVIVISHIPILAACAFFDGNNESTGNWVVPGAWMHVDARAIKDLFRQYENVRLALSGHIHLVDEVRYNQVRYFCNGAVSGGWWNGPCQEFDPGYALIDLYDDGSAERTFEFYPWKAAQ